MGRKKTMTRCQTLLRTLMGFPRTRLPQRMRKFQKFQLSMGRPQRRQRSKTVCGSCFGHSRKSVINRQPLVFLLLISTIKKFPKSEVNDSAEAKSASVSTKNHFLQESL